LLQVGEGIRTGKLTLKDALKPHYFNWGQWCSNFKTCHNTDTSMFVYNIYITYYVEVSPHARHIALLI